jgi:hypothetical protein
MINVNNLNKGHRMISNKAPDSEIEDYKNIFNNLEINKRNKEIIFQKIIQLIIQKNYYMLGPEKTITAKFIAENHADILQILSEVIRKTIYSLKKEERT